MPGKWTGGTFSLMNNSSKLTSYSYTSWSLKSGWPHFCWRQWKRARLLEGSPAFLLPSLLTTWEQVLWFLTIIKQMHTLTQSSFSAPSTFSPSSSPWLSCSPFLPSWRHVFWRILTWIEITGTQAIWRGGEVVKVLHRHRGPNHITSAD